MLSAISYFHYRMATWFLSFEILTVCPVWLHVLPLNVFFFFLEANSSFSLPPGLYSAGDSHHPSLTSRSPNCLGVVLRENSHNYSLPSESRECIYKKNQSSVTCSYYNQMIKWIVLLFPLWTHANCVFILVAPNYNEGEIIANCLFWVVVVAAIWTK